MYYFYIHDKPATKKYNKLTKIKYSIETNLPKRIKWRRKNLSLTISTKIHKLYCINIDLNKFIIVFKQTIPRMK